MFTGLIQSVGKIHLRGRGLLIEGCEPFSPLNLGDSIAVDGVCLTATEIAPNGFWADVSEETIKKTTLKNKAEFSKYVNLEPALRFSDRLGGHLLSGHIDGLGQISSIVELKKSWEIKVRWVSFDLGRYICEKGSIAINGISLTIASVNFEDKEFSISVIPHTWVKTTLEKLEIGDMVNLEADLMAKYAERLLQRNNLEENKIIPLAEEISENWLKEQGWN